MAEQRTLASLDEIRALLRELPGPDLESGAAAAETNSWSGRRAPLRRSSSVSSKQTRPPMLCPNNENGWSSHPRSARAS